jgi:hypothetical protein
VMAGVPTVLWTRLPRREAAPRNDKRGGPRFDAQ